MNSVARNREKLACLMVERMVNTMEFDLWIQFVSKIFVTHNSIFAVFSQASKCPKYD